MGFRQLDHFQGAGAVGHALEKAPLFQRHDQPMHAGLGLEIQGILHFLERGRNPFLLQALIDEKQQFELFAREHDGSLSLQETESEQTCNIYTGSGLVLQLFTFCGA